MYLLLIKRVFFIDTQNKNKSKNQIKSDEDYEAFIEANIGELKVKKKDSQEVADIKNEIKELREEFLEEQKEKKEKIMDLRKEIMEIKQEFCKKKEEFWKSLQEKFLELKEAQRKHGNEKEFKFGENQKVKFEIYHPPYEKNEEQIYKIKPYGIEKPPYGPSGYGMYPPYHEFGKFPPYYGFGMFPPYCEFGMPPFGKNGFRMPETQMSGKPPVRKNHKRDSSSSSSSSSLSSSSKENENKTQREEKKRLHLKHRIPTNLRHFQFRHLSHLKRGRLHRFSANTLQKLLTSLCSDIIPQSSNQHAPLKKNTLI